MIERPTNLLANPDAVWIFQTLILLWKEMGYTAILYFATIAGIDQELYDAASVDGAGRFQKMLHVTVPGLYATYITILVLLIGRMLSNGFEQYYLFFNPIIQEKIQVLDYYIYRVGIKQLDFPLSTALGMTKSLVSILLLTFANILSKKLKGSSIF